jgi:hypothetical protein
MHLRNPSSCRNEAAKDMDEAMAWVKRCPNPMLGPSEIDIRPLYEMAGFA